MTCNWQLLVCRWRQGGHGGGWEQKHFSPLENKIYFYVNSSRNNFCCIGPQHGHLVTWLQTKKTKWNRQPWDSPFEKMPVFGVILRLSFFGGGFMPSTRHGSWKMWRDTCFNTTKLHMITATVFSSFKHYQRLILISYWKIQAIIFRKATFRPLWIKVSSVD